jgi:hypothetical protein
LKQEVAGHFLIFALLCCPRDNMQCFESCNRPVIDDVPAFLTRLEDHVALKLEFVACFLSPKLNVFQRLVVKVKLNHAMIGTSDYRVSASMGSQFLLDGQNPSPLDSQRILSDACKRRKRQL